MTIGVDAYGWLHRGTVACAIELAMDKPTRKYAALLSSHENYGIFRGFFPYATRILLHRSVELDLLAKRLNNLDKEEAAQPDRQYKLRTVKLKPESDAERIKLLKELEVKLSEYCKIIYF